MANIQKKEERSIKSLLVGDEFKIQVKNALPKHLSPERFIRIALTALTKTPKLLACTPESFFQSLLTLSQLGLEPDGRLAHLIPYGSSCTVIVDYKGICDLAMRSGKVSNIHADIICANDVFEYDRGEVKAHKIDFKKPRGEMYAVYAICRFKDGTEASAVMTKDEVEKIRKRSKAGQDGPWVTDWNEMAKKTVFRRLSKWLPLSPEYRDALEHDHDQFEPINVTYTDTPPERGVQALESKLTERPSAAPESEEHGASANTSTEPVGTPEPDPIPKDGGKEPDVRIIGRVHAFSEKPTKKKGGMRFGILIISNDNTETWVNTFDKKLFDVANKLKHKNVDVVATAWQGEYGLELETITEMLP